MRALNIFLAFIAIILIIFFIVPQVLPDDVNPDIKDLRRNVYVTPFGVQANSRARDLCEKYQYKFVELQGLTVKERKEFAEKNVESYSQFHWRQSFLPLYAMQSDYYEKTLDRLREAYISLRNDRSQWVDCVHLRQRPD
jgi:hypothetical protein